MRKEKALIDLLQGLVNVVAEESAHNPSFAKKLESLLSPLPLRKLVRRSRKSGVKSQKVEVPDIYEEWKARGELDFRLWLQEQPITILRTLISQHDFDAARRTSKWQDTEKLSAHIADQLQARMIRGSSFLKGKDDI